MERRNMAWKPGYILTKEMYEMEYFPFWQFVKTNKSVWNSRWSDFKKACLGVPGTKLGGNNVNATGKDGMIGYVMNQRDKVIVIEIVIVLVI